MLFFHAHNLRFNVDGWTHLLIGSIAKFTTDYLNLIIRQTYKLATFVFHTKEDYSTFGIGKGYHFLCYFLLRSKRFLKLYFRGLATKTQVFKSIFCHNAIL